MSGTQGDRTAELTPESVVKFLDSNRDFAREWFLRQDWLLTECIDKATKGPLAEEEKEEGDVASEKITSSDCNPVTSSMFDALVRGRRRKAAARQRRRTKLELMGMNDKDLLMELIRDIANELDVDTLCHKILLNVSTLTRCDRGSLFLVGGSRDHKYLVSKLFDVTENSSLAGSLHTPEKQFRVPFGKGIAGTVALTKEHINIHNAYEDPRFNQEVDKQTGFRTRNILCMPILNYEGEIMGVAQIMNKTDGEAFTTEDEKMFEDYLTFCGIGLANAQLFEMSVQEYRRNQMLLSLAQGIFEEQGNMDGLVRRIMSETVTLIGVQRCCVYLIYDPVERESSEPGLPLQEALLDLDKPKHEKHSTLRKEVVFLKAFQLQAGEEAEIVDLKSVDLDKSRCAQIAKEVAESGETTNSGNYVAYTDIGTEIMEPDNFQVRSVLSLPIRDSDVKVIGVVQLMNKLNEKPFSDSDVNIVETFAIFCGLGIHNCQLYESACKMMAKQRVALEILSYHATAPVEETNKLKKQLIPAAQEYKLYSFEFSDFPLSDFETCKATVRMFLELGTINKYRIPYDVLCRWTLSVKKNYRAVTYHNWRHAFNVTQTMFTMIYTGKMSQLLGSLEMFSLLVACLSHDLDHRGTNNAFQNKVESPLAQLYSTSTMEHHHFDMCVMILNSEGNNIFMHLSPSEYRRAIKIVEAAIMATDLALYFRKRGGFEKLVKAGETKWESPEKRDLLRSMMMTACDVAAITKPWEIQKDVAQLVANEFFEQGDLERFKLHQEPIAMMDRQKKDELPSMQVGFIDSICLPVYKIFASIEPGLSPLLDGCQCNRDNWNRLAETSTPSESDESKNVSPPPESNNAKDEQPAGTAGHPVAGDKVSSETTTEVTTESQENKNSSNLMGVPLNNDVTSAQPSHQNRPQTSYVINVTTTNNHNVNDVPKKSTNRSQTNVIMQAQTTKDNTVSAANIKPDNSSKLCTLL